MPSPDGAVSRMNPYDRFRIASSLLASSAILAALVAFGPVARQTLVQAAGASILAQWGSLAGAAIILLVIWTVLAAVIFPALLRMGLLRRWILGRAFIEGGWIQAERGGPNGPRISLLSLKPSKAGLLLSSTTLTRSGEVESGLQAEYYQLNWPKLDFKFRETLPSDSRQQGEGFGEIQFDLTGGAPRRYSGCLQFAGADKRIKTEAVKLANWKERRQLRSQEGRREVIAKYWSDFFEGPITPVARDSDDTSARHGKRSGKIEILRQRGASDIRKSDTTPTADRIREEFSASAD